MDEKIELRIKYTAEDFARGFKYLQTRSSLFSLRFLLPLIIIFGTLFVLFLKNSQQFVTAFSRPEGFLPIAIPIVVFLPLLYFFKLRSKSSFLVRKQYERQINSSPALQETKTFIFDEEGIKWQSVLGNGEIIWDAFIEVAETKDDFYFFTTKKSAQIIPKRVFNTEYQQNQLRKLTKIKLGDKAKF